MSVDRTAALAADRAGRMQRHPNDLARLRQPRQFNNLPVIRHEVTDACRAILDLEDEMPLRVFFRERQMGVLVPTSQNLSDSTPDQYYLKATYKPVNGGLYFGTTEITTQELRDLHSNFVHFMHEFTLRGFGPVNLRELDDVRVLASVPDGYFVQKKDSGFDFRGVPGSWQRLINEQLVDKEVLHAGKFGKIHRSTRSYTGEQDGRKFMVQQTSSGYGKYEYFNGRSGAIHTIHKYLSGHQYVLAGVFS